MSTVNINLKALVDTHETIKILFIAEKGLTETRGQYCMCVCVNTVIEKMFDDIYSAALYNILMTRQFYI